MRENRFSLLQVGKSDFWGAGGMYGQMLMYSSQHRLAVAWHSYETTHRLPTIVDLVLQMADNRFQD